MANEFTGPKVMDWTVLPYQLTAMAWTDSNFKSMLLARPTAVMREMMRSCPPNLEFRAWENTKDRTYLPLPAWKLKLADMSTEEIRSTIFEEVGADYSLTYMLPAEVIFKSFLEPSYRQALLENPQTIIENGGYPTRGKTISVIGNTATTHNLALPFNPIDTSSLERAKEIALDAMRSVGDTVVDTTKCCASGTCD